MPSRSRRLRVELQRSLAGASTVERVFTAADPIVRRAVGADGGAWCTVDPASLLGTSCIILADMGNGPVRLVEDPRRERTIFSLELDDAEPNTFAALHRDGRNAAALTLDVGAAALPRVRRYREVMQPLAAIDELRIVLSEAHTTWGTVVLYRLFDQRPFSSADVMVARELAPAIARALRVAMLRTAVESPLLDVPPGSLIVDAGGRVMAVSDSAAELLARIGDAHARTSIESVSAAAASRGSASLNVIGASDGRRGIVALHASRLADRSGGTSVIVEHPRPIVLGAFVVESWQLTPRERDVTAALMRGRTRQQIARSLGVSTETVGELAGRVYRKAGVASRAELCDAVFARDYAPLRSTSTPPSPYGFFLAASRAAAVPETGHGSRPTNSPTFAENRTKGIAMEPGHREDLISQTHVALRKGLFDVTAAVGATDWSDDVAVTTLQTRWATIIRLLVAHAAHEDDHIYPLLTVDEALSIRLREEHLRLHEQLDRVDAAIAAAVHERSKDLVGEAYRGLASFTAEYLLHLADEEAHLLPVLWERYSDDDLRATRAAMLGAAAPGDLIETQLLLLPAISPAERREVILNGRRALPPKAFAMITTVLRSRLPAGVWASIADLAAADEVPA